MWSKSPWTGVRIYENGMLHSVVVGNNGSLDSKNAVVLRSFFALLKQNKQWLFEASVFCFDFFLFNECERRAKC